MTPKVPSMPAPKGTKRLAAYLEPELALAFRIECLKEGVSVSRLLNDLVRRWLKERGMEAPVPSVSKGRSISAELHGPKWKREG